MIACQSLSAERMFLYIVMDLLRSPKLDPKSNV